MGLFDRGWVKISFEDANTLKSVLLGLSPTPQAPFFGVERRSKNLEQELVMDFATGIDETLQDITRMGPAWRDCYTKHTVKFGSPQCKAIAQEKGIELFLRVSYVRNHLDKGTLQYEGLIPYSTLSKLVQS